VSCTLKIFDNVTASALNVLAIQNNQERTTSKEKPGQECQNRAPKGQGGKNNQERTARTGLSGMNNQDRTVRKGQRGQDCTDRTKQ
jgi:hypothetical protein